MNRGLSPPCGFSGEVGAIKALVGQGIFGFQLLKKTTIEGCEASVEDGFLGKLCAGFEYPVVLDQSLTIAISSKTD